MIQAILIVLTLSLPEQSTGDLEKTVRRVEGNIQLPKKVKDVPVKYPKSAQQVRLEGRVVIECVIDKEGRIAGTKVLEGVSPLSEAAVEAVREWRYSPTVLMGEVVPIVMQVNVNFEWYEWPDPEQLLKALKSDYESIRESAVTHLGRTQGLSGRILSKTLEALHVLAEKDSSERVRDAAAKALSRLEKK